MIKQFVLSDPTESNNLNHFDSVDFHVYEDGSAIINWNDKKYKCSDKAQFLDRMQKIYEKSIYTIKSRRSKKVDIALMENIDEITGRSIEIKHHEEVCNCFLNDRYVTYNCVFTDSYEVVKNIIKQHISAYNKVYINPLHESNYDYNFKGYKWIEISEKGDAKHLAKSRLHAIYLVLKDLCTSRTDEREMIDSGNFYVDGEGSNGIAYVVAISNDNIIVCRYLEYYGK